MFLAIEGREQRALSSAEVDLDIDHIHPDVPFAEGSLFKAGVGGVVEFQDKERDQLFKQLPRRLRQIGTTLTATSTAPPAALANVRDQDGHRKGCGILSCQDAATEQSAMPESKKPPLFSGGLVKR
jgi:hypothetical protein